MTRRSLAALAFINVVLVVALAVVSIAPTPAKAQLGQPANQFMMIAGLANARSDQQVIWLLDLSQQQLAASFFNSANDEFTVVATRPLGNAGAGRP